MRTILTIFAGFAVVPLVILLLVTIATIARTSNVDYFILGMWLIAAIAIAACIMALGFIIGLVVESTNPSER